MDTRLFPLSPVLFQEEILPLIEGDYFIYFPLFYMF